MTSPAFSLVVSNHKQHLGLAIKKSLGSLMAKSFHTIQRKYFSRNNRLNDEVVVDSHFKVKKLDPSLPYVFEDTKSNAIVDSQFKVKKLESNLKASNNKRE